MCEKLHALCARAGAARELRRAHARARLQAGVPRFIVPFDEDQFTMTPGFENVTTLDAVHIAAPGGGGRAPAGGGGSQTRQQSNEEALRYFRGTWDIAWNAPRYAIGPYKPKGRSRNY